ncbi:multidrug transporter [Rufibacter sp. DG15C]|uniref:EamA family transporter n=1 Tax=Rufibacter sp. DG15C TaxID=1379909 RepID=UPI00078BE3D2|nr:DMT family transporter [Rufibacter sp. DG15C]AMM52517.1 multidrug transporter [Rufibacter sp. DG15C]
MFRGGLLVFLGACSFGVVSTFVKLAYKQGYTLGDVTGSQAFFAMLILWPLYFLQTRSKAFRDQQKPQTTPTWKLLLAGTTNGLVSMAYYQCVQMTQASVAIILLMQFTWISILIEAILFKKKPTLLQMLAVVLVLGGTVLASGMLETQVENLSWAGIGFGMLAALGYSIFLIVNGRVGNELSPVKKSAWMLTGSTILVFVVFPPVFLINGSLMQGLGALGIVFALFAAVIPPVLFAKGIPRAGVVLSSILSTVELPVAVAMSYFILHEPVTAMRWVGVGIILLALVLPNLKRKKQLATL